MTGASLRDRVLSPSATEPKEVSAHSGDAPSRWHKRCGDCVTIRKLPFCVMNCGGIPNIEKAYI